MEFDSVKLSGTLFFLVSKTKHNNTVWYDSDISFLFFQEIKEENKQIEQEGKTPELIRFFHNLFIAHIKELCFLSVRQNLVLLERWIAFMSCTLRANMSWKNMLQV